MRIQNQVAPTAQNGFGAGQQIDSNQIVQQLVMELIRAVFTAMMQQQAQGQGPGAGDAFTQGGQPGGLGGAPNLAGANTAVSQGALPKILGGGCGAGGAPNLGTAFDDPRRTPGSFDAGRFLVQRLMQALPQPQVANGAGAAAQPGAAAPCGCAGAAQAKDPLQANKVAGQNPQLALNDGQEGKAPDFFDALNVPKELRGATEGCGPKGCCRWELAIA